jgi:hypothetical protein
MHRALDRHPNRVCRRQHQARLNAELHLLAEVYLGRDLTAMVTKNAHHHDDVCGVRRSDDGDVRRLLLRSAQRVHAVDLAEANYSDRIGEAGG